MILNPIRECLWTGGNTKQVQADAGDFIPGYGYGLKAIFRALPLRLMVKHHQLIRAALLRRSENGEPVNVQAIWNVDGLLAQTLSNLGQPLRDNDLLQGRLPGCVD